MTNAKNNPESGATVTTAVPASTPASRAKSVNAAAGTAKPKTKLVRDSFTIPKPEYLVLDALKLRAAKLGRPSKKSEVLRAGIGALNAMSDKALLTALNFVPSLKTGRPKTAPSAKKATAAQK